MLISINKNGRNHFTQNDLVTQKHLSSATSHFITNLKQKENLILTENSLRSILNLTRDLYKFGEISCLILELTKRVKELLKTSDAKFLLTTRDDQLVEFTSEGETKHNGCGSLAKEVIKQKASKSLIKRTSGCLYNETVDLVTSLPIICMPILNPHVEVDPEFMSTEIPEGIPKRVVLGVLQVANPRAMLMEYNLLLKSIDLDILSQF